MHSRLVQITAAVCASALFFTGCTNIKNDQTRTKTEGTLAGAGIGALLGAGIGALAGGGGRSIATGALIGAAAGGVAGHEYGKKVAKKKQGYAASEERLRKAIGSTRSTRISAENYNSNLRRAIAQQRSELNRISSAKRSGQNVSGDASRLRRNLDGNIERSNDQLKEKSAVLSNVKATLDDAPAGSSKSQLQAEYNSLAQEKALLSKQVQQMNGMKADLATASR